MKLTLLIPCHNEETGLGKCLESALRQTRPIDEILVINDGSTDKTTHILDDLAASHPVIIPVHLTQNTGNKSRAQEIGFQYVTGDIIIMTDGDTLLDPHFAEKIENAFANDHRGNLAAVSGRVRSLKHNWITACRQIDYAIGFDVFKQAQAIIGYVFVMPGCATAIRTEALRELRLDHDTVTEDLDLTYQIHLKGWRIEFRPDALVYTQDPPNLASYIRQMRRWYAGSWQNFMKYHSIMFRKPAAALELTLIVVEGLVYPSLLFGTMLLFPIYFFVKILPFYLAAAFAFSVYAAIRNRRLDLIGSFPDYLWLMFLNGVLSIIEFFSEVVFHRKNLVWHKADRVNIP